MPGDNIFAEDWRDCLRSHYLHVVHEQDSRTERTLRGVMHNVGFSDDELNELRVLATMHVDDMGADFTPDLGILEAETDPVGAVRKQSAGLPPPLQPDPSLDEAVIEDETVGKEQYEDGEPPQYDESGPQQIALF